MQATILSGNIINQLFATDFDCLAINVKISLSLAGTLTAQQLLHFCNHNRVHHLLCHSHDRTAWCAVECTVWLYGSDVMCIRSVFPKFPVESNTRRLYSIAGNLVTTLW